MNERSIGDVATAETPLIRNAWYVGATSDEVGEALMSRWILGRTVLLYRTEAGKVVAMDNRCPHRSFPLANGRRVGDDVACGYHGMTFDPEGRCVMMPPIGKAPGNLRVQVFPVVERAPLVWLWLGDPALADEALIPHHPSLTEAGWSTVSGYYHVKANYVGLHENLQDLSHFEHLHSSSIGVPTQTAADMNVEDRGDQGIFSTRVYANVAPPPMWKRVLDLAGDTITREIAESFRSPALCEATTRITDDAPGSGELRDYYLRIQHFITPESQDTTHYFWFFMRDFQANDDQVSQTVQAGIAAAFLEDKDALESIVALTREDSRKDFREMSFMSDKPGIMLRRRLAALARKELDLNQTGTAATSATPDRQLAQVA